MRIRTLLGGFLAAMTIGASAQAATVTFDFSAASSGNWSNSLSYSVGGVGLTVTGGDTSGGSAKVQTWKGHGLGAKSQSDCTFFGICLGTDHQIDSDGRDDVVKFSFSKAVSITALLFNYVDNGDTFDFYVGGSKAFNAAVGQTVAVANALGTSFWVGAGVTTFQSCSARTRTRAPHCTTQTINSAFKLRGVTVNVPDDPAPVPVPAAGLLLLGGLGGLAMVRRRVART